MREARRSADQRAALRIAAIYAAVAAVWIFFSDLFLDLIFGPLAHEWQTVKGLLFVAVTAGLLYALMLSELAARSRAHAALRASEERYALVARAVNDGVWDWDLATGQGYSSPRWKEILGFQDDELVSERTVFFDKLHPDDRPLVEAALQAHFDTGQRYSMELRLRHKDGGYRWVHSRGEAVRDAAGRPVRMVGASTDITERKQAEAALHETQALLMAFLEQVPALVFVSGVDGQLRLVNTRWEAWAGRKRATVLGRPIAEVFTGRQLADFLDSNRQVVEAGQPLTFERHLPGPDGEQVFEVIKFPLADAAGRLDAIGGISLDITERKRAEAALRESEARHRHIAALMTDYVYAGTVNAAGAARTEWVSGAFEAITGYTPAEVNALPGGFAALLLPEDLAAVLAQRPHLHAGEATTMEYRLRARSGEVRWLRDRVQSAPDDGPGPERHLIGAVQDITEQKRAEQALRESEERYRSLVEQAPIGLALHQAGRVLFVNPAMAQLLGAADPAGLIGRPLRDFVHPEAWPATEARLAALPAGFAGQTPVENRYVRVDGQVIDVQVHATRVEYDGRPAIQLLAQDITERKRADLALRQTQARLAEALEIAQLAYWEYDFLTDTFTFNDQFYAVHHTSLEREGSYCLSSARYAERFVHPEDAGVVADEISRALAATDPDARRQVEHRIRYGDGGIGYITVRFQIEKDALGRTVWMRGVNQDVTARRHAEDALRASEARYRSTLDHLLEGGQLIGFDWRYIYVNETAARHARQPASALLGRSMLEVFPGIEATPLFSVLRRCLAERVAHQLENEFVYPDGASGFFELNIQPVPEGLFILSSDITERKRAEAARHESEARLQLALNAARMGVWEWIPQTGAVVWSPECYVIHGVSEFAGTLAAFQALVHPEDLERVMATVNGALAARTVYSAEFRIQRADGAVRWVANLGQAHYAADGTPQRLVGAIQDITERKQAEAALRDSEARLTGIIESAMDAILSVDAQQRVVVFNAAAEQMFGCAAAEAVGRPLDQFLPQRFWQARAEFVRAFGQGSADQALLGALGSVTGRRANGEEFPIEASISQIEVAGDRYYTAILRDVTERRRQEVLLRQQFDMLTALYAGARQLAQSLDLGAVAAAVARACVENFGARLAWLGEARPDGDVTPLAHWPLELDYPRQLRVRWDETPAGQGPTGRAIRSRQPVVAQDLAAEAGYAPWRAAAAAARLHASAAFPLVHQDQALGALNLYSEQDVFFSPERLELFQAFAHQAAAALANARLYASVTEQREQLRGLAARLAAADESERRSVARELHDRVGANLTALSLNLTLVRGRLSPETAAAVGPRLDDTMTLLQETMTQVRNVMMELRPSVLDDYGLLAALRWHAGQVAQRHDLAVAVSGAPPELRLPTAVETALFRISQEAMTNIVKHAHATRVRVHLEAIGPRVRLTIADDGRGFAVGEAAGRPQDAYGWGLSLMRERALSVGADLRVESSPGRGTQVIVEVAQ